jgi:hypothetical protein
MSAECKEFNQIWRETKQPPLKLHVFCDDIQFIKRVILLCGLKFINAVALSADIGPYVGALSADVASNALALSADRAFNAMALRAPRASIYQ